MLDPGDLYQKTIALVNTQQGGHLRPQRNFISWLNDISRELFKEKFKDFEKGQSIDDELAKPFLRSVNVKVTALAGSPHDIIPYPDDYGYLASIRVLVDPDNGVGCPCAGLDALEEDGSCTAYKDSDLFELAEKIKGQNLKEGNATKIDNQRWGSALDNPFKKPTYEKPVVTQFDGGFKIFPKGIGTVVLDYLKKPKDATYEFTLGPDDTVIYNPTTSVKLDWTDGIVNEFLARLKIRYAAYTKQADMYQEGMIEKKETK